MRAAERWWAPLTRPLFAGLVLMIAFFALSLPNDAAGFLGTDTGGKVATLETIDETGTFDLDVGYWAADVDPEGEIHPLWFTSQFDDKWVQVTTLPLIVIAAPLYAVGGYELVLVLPMLGGVAAAFAARALARRVGDGTGWTAFWLTGLASPVTIYALDFWEHTIGLALMAWGAVALLDAVDDRSYRVPLVAFGAAFGLAATMRTEALVYALVAGLVLIWPLVRSGQLLRAAGAGLLSGISAVAVLVANALLEIAVLGSTLRSGRAASAASSGGGGGDELTERVKEGTLTLFGARASFELISYVVGGAIVALIVAGVVLARRDRSASRRYVGFAGLLQLSRLLSGLGFVPGALTAGPTSAFGLGVAVEGSAGRSGHRGRLIAIALGSLPLVWAFQYQGGAPPQWGGRYVLLSGLLLGVLGAGWLARADRWMSAAGVALAVVVTFSGVAWAWQRTNGVADAMRTLADRPEEVLVSDLHHFWREGGAFWGQTNTLTVVDDSGKALLDRVLEANDVETLAWVQPESWDVPDVAGYEVASEETIAYLPGVDLTVTSLRRS